MAKLIKARRRSVEVTDSQVRQWHTGFFESFDGSFKAFRKESEELDKAGTIEVVLDGTFYDLWYSQAVSEMSFSLAVSKWLWK